MKIEIVHASIAENGTINGVKGDQTGGEVCIRDFYDRKWNYILRPKRSELAIDMVHQAIDAAENPHIGYGQADRLSLWKYICMTDCAYLSDVEEDVNCDCSSLIAVLCNLAGCKVPADLWTGNLRDCLMRSGDFQALTYHDGDKLLAGDILLAVGHTAIVVSVSSGAEEPVDDDPVDDDPVVEFADRFHPSVAGLYFPVDLINVRSGPGLDRPVLRVRGRNDPVRCYGYCSEDNRGVLWLLVMDMDDRIGWVSNSVVDSEDDLEVEE